MSTQPPAPPAGEGRGLIAVFTTILNSVGTIWIVLLMLIIVADILSRNILNAPIAGTPEMVSFSIVGIVFLQLSHALRSGALTRSDILLDLLERRWPKGRRVLLALFHLTGAVILTIALWRFFPSLVTAWEKPARNYMGNPGVFTLPRWPLYLLMCFGMLATILQFLELVVKALKGERA